MIICLLNLIIIVSIPALPSPQPSSTPKLPLVTSISSSSQGYSLITVNKTYTSTVMDTIIITITGISIIRVL